ncbi:hypothetical protein SF1_08910 [Sphingobacterium faecium NBRC 15299]|uniref:hypothetical protein n=1 Tax=Sphingobacterium faecium TaxID=34087 RepID=UPI000D33412B|nr:hypothetical protein [Sphingobacterium faecium]PTX11038.1 hypothetical protein C8N37_104319 [Sphingobacterium faecium]GEM62909.1 hypothetical protein SF1_08910 [Sphingobacterium faecium NBRC 15299]
MNVIITYDIKRNHTEIKDELKRLGYVDTIKGISLSDNKTPVDQKLPNTTLIKYGVTSTLEVMNFVIGVIKEHNGGLDNIFCAELAVTFSWNGRQS